MCHPGKKVEDYSRIHAGALGIATELSINFSFMKNIGDKPGNRAAGEAIGRILARIRINLGELLAITFACLPPHQPKHRDRWHIPRIVDVSHHI